MRLLHIITGLGNGGAEAVLFRLVTGDRSNKHVVVSLGDEGWYGPLLRSQSVRVEALGMGKGASNLRALGKLAAIIRQVDPDAVQTWMYHADVLGGVVARLRGRRAVVWGIHNSSLDPRSTSWSTRAVARVASWVSGIVPATIVSCSNQSVSSHVAIGYGREKFVVVPNGYDLERFRPSACARARLRCEWNVPEGTTVMGMVARWDPLKDHANLLSALALLPADLADWRLVLVGTGITEENTELAALISSRGLRGRMLLLGPRSDIPDIMSALDLHVLSSSGEAFPNVLAESMCCGTPCVTTDVGDAALIVGDAGWVAEPSSPQSLCAAVLAALRAFERGARDDGSTWSELQQKCRTLIMQRYGLHRMIQGYHAAWTAAASAERARLAVPGKPHP